VTALQGIRVVDLSRLLPGPFCTQLLVDLGAEVIKVEEPAGGDYLRHMPPHLDDGTCVLFHALNRGKKSVCLDLKLDDDRTKLLALLATADVLVESFRPGVMAKLGLSPERLLEENPRLVVCSISGYSQTGEYRLKAGHDLNYLARAGALGMMKEPTVLPIQVADLAGGALPAAFQICAALVGRARTGKGALIDVSMTHNIHGLLASSFARNAAVPDEELGGGRDLLVGRVPCYGVYRVKDGFISIGSLEPKFWQGLCAALEMPELRDRGMDDGAAGDEVRALLGARLATKTKAEWHAHFAAHDVCVEVVRTPEEALADPAFQKVDVVVEGKTVTLPIPAVGLAGAVPSTTRAPKLGEHTDEILRSLAEERRPGALPRRET
jgi:crotonobetainyl-CoA:carnitine CoA-transferase CaiB-like acyl-CoA transferase